MTEKKVNRRQFVKILIGVIGGLLFSSQVISAFRTSIPIIRSATPERESILTVEGRELNVGDIPVGGGVNATYLGYDFKGKEQEHDVIIVRLKPGDIKKRLIM